MGLCIGLIAARLIFQRCLLSAVRTLQDACYGEGVRSTGLPRKTNISDLTGGSGGVLDRRDVLDLMHDRSRMRPSHPYNAGTEHADFSPTRQTLIAPSAKPRGVSGELHEG